MDRRSLFKIEHSGGQRTEIPRIQTEPLRHAWAERDGVATLRSAAPVGPAKDETITWGRTDVLMDGQ